MILFELIDYDVLRVIWWLLLGVLLIGFALTDGFDMGVGALLPFVAKTDTERRVVINTVGPRLGRQPSVVHPRRRRDLRRLAAALRGQLLGLLPCDVRGPGGLHRAARGVQVPLQAGLARLAVGLGLGAVCRWRGARADLRRGGRQRAAGRAVHLTDTTLPDV
jgi:hypothetical protein